MRNDGSTQLSRRLVETIGGLIVRGDAMAGKSLPTEAELSVKYDVSRTAVREAVKMLTAKGLVGSRPRRGTYVEPEAQWNMLDPDVVRWILQRRFSLELMHEFLIARKAIEPAAAREASLHRDKSAILSIAQALVALEAAHEGFADPLESDIAFHVSILEASGNRFFRQFAPVVETALRFSIQLTNQAKGVKAADVESHALIYEAIREGDGEKAANATDKLLDEAIGLVARLQAEKDANEA